MVACRFRPAEVECGLAEKEMSCQREIGMEDRAKQSEQEVGKRFFMWFP